MCGLFRGAHKSLEPRARTLLGGLGQATLSFFAVATLLFVFIWECPKFCDLAKQRREIVGGVSEVGKDDFSLFFSGVRRFLRFFFSSAAIARRPTLLPLTTVEDTPPRGRPSATPTASNAGPQERTLWARCWVPTPAPTAPGAHGSPNPGRPPQRTGGWGRDSAPTPDAPHNGGRPPPPETAPRHPRGTQPPQGMQAKGTVLGPHTHTPPPHSTWVADPKSPPSGRAVGGGGAPDLRCPS